MRLLCEILGVSKTRYYHWTQAPLSVREQKREEIDKMIKDIFHAHKERYGSTRIFHELKARGIACTRAKVSERMKALNLVAKARKKYRVTTDSNPVSYTHLTLPTIYSV